VLSNFVALNGAVRGTENRNDCAGYAAIEERVDQQRLLQISCNTSTSDKVAKNKSIMGWGR
jgi:hypothetical protein